MAIPSFQLRPGFHIASNQRPASPLILAPHTARNDGVTAEDTPHMHTMVNWSTKNRWRDFLHWVASPVPCYGHQLTALGCSEIPARWDAYICRKIAIQFWLETDPKRGIRRHFIILHQNQPRIPDVWTSTTWKNPSLLRIRVQTPTVSTSLATAMRIVEPHRTLIFTDLAEQILVL